jgi:hypothetical protein
MHVFRGRVQLCLVENLAGASQDAHQFPFQRSYLASLAKWFTSISRQLQLYDLFQTSQILEK